MEQVCGESLNLNARKFGSAGAFQLETLFVNSDFDFEKIIAAQKSLVTVGIFDGSGWGADAPLPFSPSLDYQSPRPMVIMGLHRETFIPRYNYIHLLPNLLSPQQALSFDKIICDTFSMDRMSGIVMDSTSVGDADVYLHRPLPSTTLSPFLEAIPRAFPKLSTLNFFVKCCHFDSVVRLTVPIFYCRA